MQIDDQILSVGFLTIVVQSTRVKPKLTITHRNEPIEQSNFQWLSKVFRGSIDYSSPSSVIGPENLHHSQTVKCKTETNHDLFTRVFPRFSLNFPLSYDWLFWDIFLISDWPSWLLWFHFHDNRKVLWSNCFGLVVQNLSTIWGYFVMFTIAHWRAFRFTHSIAVWIY